MDPLVLQHLDWATGCRNIKTSFAHYAARLSAHPCHHLTQRPVIHIHDTLPNHGAWINVQVAFCGLDVVINHRCQQIVGLFNRREITRKVQVDIFHWNNL